MAHPTVVIRIGLIAGWLALCPSLWAVEVTDATARYIERAEFTRIGEFFHGREVSTSRLIVRSLPEARDGQYFLLWLDEPIEALPTGSRAQLEILSSRSQEMRTFDFDLSGSPQDTKRLYLGLTGSDWTGESEYALAWRVTLFGPDGEALAVYKSFLWEMP